MQSFKITIKKARLITAHIPWKTLAENFHFTDVENDEWVLHFKILTINLPITRSLCKSTMQFATCSSAVSTMKFYSLQ